MKSIARVCVLFVLLHGPVQARAEGDWEITPDSEQALQHGLEWLARNQGPQGNWESNDLGLVGMGALAFLSAGHLPGRGPYGEVVDRALDYILQNAQPSGLLNISHAQRDMYNHGLAAFVLGQAHGMSSDARLGPALDRALKLIAHTQAEDGGWDYRARRQQRGHDLSLAVMQAKALRSAVDSGLEVPRDVILAAIQSVREHYTPKDGAQGLDDPQARIGDGQFTYNRGGGATLAMAAAGIVCLQEFGQYDDWRIPKNLDVIHREIRDLGPPRPGDGKVAFDAYTLYYVGQALYQVGGRDWEQSYPKLRDYLVATQHRKPGDPRQDGYWDANRHVGGKPGQLYGTSVACFILAIPNRYLPILQEGKIESLRTNLGDD
jgi:hypothetical protein